MLVRNTINFNSEKQNASAGSWGCIGCDLTGTEVNGE